MGQEADRAAFVANGKQRARSSNRWDYLAYLPAVVEYASGLDDPIARRKHLLQYRIRVDEDQQRATGSDSLAPSPRRDSIDRYLWWSIEELAKDPKEIASDFARDLFDGLTGYRAQETIKSSVASWSRYKWGQENAENNLSRVWELARDNPDLADAFDDVFGSFFGASIRDAANTILSNNPDTKESIERALPPGVKFDELTEDKIQKILVDHTSKLLSENEARFAEIRADLDSNSKKLDDFLEERLHQERVKQEARLQAERTRIDIAGFRGLASLAFVLVKDRATGRQIAATLNLGADFLELSSRFAEQMHAAKALAEGAGQAKLMSSLAFGGGLASAAIAWMSVFTPDEDPREGVVALLKDLSSQISQFREEVLVGLQAINESIYLLNQQLDSQFRTLYQGMVQLSFDVQSTRESMSVLARSMSVALALQLDRLDYLVSAGLRTAEQEIVSIDRDQAGNVSEADYIRLIKSLRVELASSDEPIFVGPAAPVPGAIGQLHEIILRDGNPAIVRLLAGLASGAVPMGIANPDRLAAIASLLIRLSSFKPDLFLRESAALHRDLLDRIYQIESIRASAVHPSGRSTALAGLVALMRGYASAVSAVTASAAVIRQEVAVRHGISVDPASLVASELTMRFPADRPDHLRNDCRSEAIQALGRISAEHVDRAHITVVASGEMLEPPLYSPEFSEYRGVYTTAGFGGLSLSSVAERLVAAFPRLTICLCVASSGLRFGYAGELQKKSQYRFMNYPTGFVHYGTPHFYIAGTMDSALSPSMQRCCYFEIREERAQYFINEVYIGTSPTPISPEKLVLQGAMALRQGLPTFDRTGLPGAEKAAEWENQSRSNLATKAAEQSEMVRKALVDALLAALQDASSPLLSAAKEMETWALLIRGYFEFLVPSLAERIDTHALSVLYAPFTPPVSPNVDFSPINTQSLLMVDDLRRIVASFNLDPKTLTERSSFFDFAEFCGLFSKSLSSRTDQLTKALLEAFEAVCASESSMGSHHSALQAELEALVALNSVYSGKRPDPVQNNQTSTLQFMDGGQIGLPVAGVPGWLPGLHLHQ